MMDLLFFAQSLVIKLQDALYFRLLILGYPPSETFTMLNTHQLEELLLSPHPLERYWATHLNASSNSWETIYAQHPHLAFLLAQNPHIPVALADQLAEHRNPKVRLMVARHPQLSRISLERLAQDDEAAIRLQIAKRDDLPAYLIEGFEQDPDAAIHTALQRYQQPHLQQVVDF